MHTHISSIRLAADCRRSKTKQCVNEYFRRFGAFEKLKRGDYETQNPDLPDDIGSCDLEDLQRLKEAIGEYLDAMLEWEHACKEQFGEDRSDIPRKCTLLMDRVKTRIHELSKHQAPDAMSLATNNSNAPIIQYVGHVDKIEMRIEKDMHVHGDVMADNAIKYTNHKE